MQSWSLKKFVDEFGCIKASKVWGVSHQAVLSAVCNDRDIRIVELDGIYSVHESKLLSKNGRRIK